MATTDDYRTGKIVEGIRKAEALLGSRSAIADGDSAFERIREKILGFRPVWITRNETVGLIGDARIIAVGERVCRALHPESPETQSVFLDELAEAMVEAGRAVFVTTEEVELIIVRQQRQKFIASLVSGKYLELCAVHPPDCFFCKAERAGIRCFERNTDSPD
jgi:hypothetical protein